MILFCKNILCIYQRENKCTLEETSINQYGICCEYVFPDIEDLEKLKEATARMIDESGNR